MKSYTELMKELREDNDLKQSEVAKIIGTTQQHYSKYETGEYETPIRVITALADHYNVSTDYILGRTESTQGVDALSRPVILERTAGRLLSEILALSEKGRQAVVDYVELQTIKEAKDK